MAKKTRFLIIIVISCIFISVLSACTFAKKSTYPITKTDFALDTIISVTLYDESKTELIDTCFDIAKKYDILFDKNNTDSDIYKINSSVGQFVEVNTDTIYLIEKGIYYGELSNGAFDISIGRLSTLWDFQNRKSVPLQDEINNNLGFNYKNIEITNDNKVRLITDKEMIDLGGIAKGFIADKIKEYLINNNVNEGIINLGGNVVCLDKKGKTDNYKIGIAKPFSEDGDIACYVNTNNKSIVTSGDYQRYFIENGRIYHHILNTITGYPIDNDLDSVTIICNESTAGDALSTITYTYGLDKGLTFIESLPDTEAIFITKDGNIYKTGGIDNNMFKVNE